MIDWFTDPYATGFMRRAGIMALLIGVLAPTIGVWVVLRRLAYLGDAMSHGTLAGVAIAYLAGISITVGALAAGVVMGLLVAFFDRQRRLGHDSAIGVAETFMFATGLVLISRNDNIGVDLTHLLLGQIVTTSTHDIVVNSALTALALGILAIAFSDLRNVTFDPGHARQVGIPVGPLRLVLVVLISITVVVSLGTVGLLMSVAMLVVPAATARLVTQRVETMTAVAIAVGVLSAVVGLTASYHLATPPGPTIALATVACFAVAATVTMHRAIAGRQLTAPRVSDPS
jgi:ABC-type Mn2+/Zn2+ transport system permease subunit